MFDPTQIVGNISSYIGDLTTGVLQEINNPIKIPIRKLVEASEVDPIASACINLKAARGMQLMTCKYTHPNRQVQNWINNQFEIMTGNLPELAGKLSGASAFGYSTAEFGFYKSRREWGLDRFHLLDPTYTYYKALNGELVNVKYIDGGLEKSIPHWKVLHIVSGLPNAFGRKTVYGVPEMLRAYPFIKLKQLIFAEMGIAAKRLATGILLGQTDSGTAVKMLDKNGKPIPNGKGGYKVESAVSNLAKQLKKIETNSFIVTDKSNSVSAVAIPAGEQFWNLAVSMLDTQILRSFLCPDTIWAQGVASFGAGGLSTNQLHILDSTINAVMQQVKDQLLEKVIKRLIIWNFGVQETYGKFEESRVENEQNNQMIANTLLQTLSMGIIPQSDIQAMNKLRELLKLPELDPTTQRFQAEMNTQLQKIQQGMADMYGNPTEAALQQQMMAQMPQEQQPYP